MKSDYLINFVVLGDCKDRLSEIPDNSIDMIFTSPPYADRRHKVYDGMHEKYYFSWFHPIAKELYRVLKPSGSFFLNIKPHTRRGERSLYVFDLVIGLQRGIGFKFVDEFCWTKNAFPGSLKGRFKNGFEPVYHFTKSNNITFNPLACGTPVKEESRKRAFRKQCGAPENGSGMTGMNTTNLRTLKLARPSNVIHVNNVSNQFSDKKLHPATFPEGLVEFFVKSFTNEGDIVLDPFAGSGTVGIVCNKLNRGYYLIEKEEKYLELIKKRLYGQRNENTEVRETPSELQGA